jgi:cephalosporin hydroxylase
MFPFWDDVIAPFIDAVRARRVIEIGALRGETTVRMLERLGAGCELHVIDPLPQFDPAEHEAAFPGRYIFHLGTSHDVLPTLPPADVALVDGDHNWFTVYHELRMLAATARDAGEPLPLLVLHDVAWPYGRRDLYYEPSRIPAEFRQPHRRAGMRRDRSGLVPGGMNNTLDNAEHEGGPRNGVMTALDDFVAEHDGPLRRLVLPIYYGLAVVADEARLAANPELGALFDRFESLEGQRFVVELAERIRLDEAIFAQAWIRVLQEQVQRGVRRYLATTKAALLDEHYLENELRLEHLGTQLGAPTPDLAPLRDPARLLSVRFQKLSQARAAGKRHDGDRAIAYFPYTDMGHAQLDRLEHSLGALHAGGIGGDVAEIGVGRGGGAIFQRAFLDAHEVKDRTVWVVDRFLATESGGATGGIEGEPSLPAAVSRFGADLHQVRDGFARFGLLDDTVRFLQGPPAQAVTSSSIDRLALVRLGDGLGAEVGPVLEAVTPRLVPGAIVIVSGTANPGVEQAVLAARHRLGTTAPLERIDWNAVTWQVPLDAPEPAPASPPEPAAGQGPKPALSVVVVFYDMLREAKRTLHSLSRAYQREVEDLDYEVIVVDNGSSPEQRLTEELVSSFGPEFRLLDMGAAASPSPIAALNAGIKVSRGENLALMIDGAHVLTPGVLRHGMLALTTYAPAVVATQQWYVGPGQQGDVQQTGYDQQVEDRLFASIGWPVDGYRLFEISHFIGERDWFDGIVESNCLFAPRSLVEQVGGFDEAFSMPGGGYANLDLYERLGLDPRVNPASILGEGTFHQFHGGTTTNVADEAERRDKVASYGEHFRELRGRPLAGLGRPVRFVGALDRGAARRTRSRRGVGTAMDAMRDPTSWGLDARVPVPDELKLAAIEAVWDHQGWRDTTWLGHPLHRYPSDLFAYQELLSRLRPSLVVVVGDDDGLGGRALYVASICDLLDHGSVIAVGRSDPASRPSHPRVTHLGGQAETDEVAAQVLAAAPAEPDALVLLGLGNHHRVMQAFEHYAPLVGTGGYVVIENTVVNGRPVSAGFGAGPQEAVFQLLSRQRGFVIDPTMERYTVTFNRNGYLRRLEQE